MNKKSTDRTTCLIFAALLLSAAPPLRSLPIQETANADQATAEVESGPELEKKREGRYINGFPGAGYSPEMGYFLSGMIGLYNNGSRTDGYFTTTPYRTALTASALVASRGMASLEAIWDAPYFAESDFRLRGEFLLLRNPLEPYFGVGMGTLGPLRTPEGRIYDAYGDYLDDLRRIEDGSTDAYFDMYRRGILRASLLVERSCWDGRIRLGAGVLGSRIWVHDHTGDEVPGKPASGGGAREFAVMRTTRLRLDHEAGKILGFEGGWNNSLRLGLAFDTRDLEPYPRKGMFHDLFLVWSHRVLGSDFDYRIASFMARFYTSPFPEFLDLVLAARVALSVKSGELPFFNMNAIPTTERLIKGLGGVHTLRGFHRARFVGPVMAFCNLEARLKFASFKIGANRIELAAAPFYDIGRVYDRVRQLSASGMKSNYGVGLRVAVSQSFVFSLDLGFSSEESPAFNVSFGQIF